jgi:hypothetical protein
MRKGELGNGKRGKAETGIHHPISSQFFLVGRPLNVDMDCDHDMLGLVQDIFVSRLDILSSARDEILFIKERNRQLPLKIHFVGEDAEDQGDLRREFLRELWDSVRERYLQQDGGLPIATEIGFLPVDFKFVGYVVGKNYYF